MWGRKRTHQRLPSHQHEVLESEKGCEPEGFVCPPFVELGGCRRRGWRPSAGCSEEEQVQCHGVASGQTVVRALTKCQISEIAATINSA